MVATGSMVAATGESVERFARDELAELVLEASTHLETDMCKAKLCIQRAAHLVRDRKDGGAHGVGTPVPQGLAMWQIRKLTAYIEANISEQIRTADLACVARISIGHFFRSFRASFSMSPHVFVMRQRIIRAEVRMATSTDSLARIATECGLSDQAHLCRSFRRFMGVSPKIWRRSAGVQPEVEDRAARHEPRLL
jgi:transcriptional regulator GlxA family with amidase domain